MTSFVYQVRESNGTISSGVLSANDMIEASRQLRQDGNVIVSLQEERRALSGTENAPRKKRIRSDDVIYFATQLAVMVDTGVPLSEALDAISSQCEHPSMKSVIEDLSLQVKGGSAFSAALESHPKVFDTLFVAMMRASEASGRMGEILQEVSEYMARQREIRNQVKGAMTYPLCMLVFCILVVVGMMLFILPRFENIYAGKGAALPIPTRMLLGMSKGLLTYWPAVLAVMIGGGVAAWYYLRRPAGKIFLDRVKIHMPILGPMYRKAFMARSLQTMATMVETGVSMIEGLSITAQVAGNYFYAKIWTDLIEAVKGGSSISEQLYECPLMPRTVVQMISAGEKSGRLSEVMDRLSQFCEKDLSVSVKTVTQMIEPLMIMIMGAVVGGIALALLLPIFSISKVVAH